MEVSGGGLVGLGVSGGDQLLIKTKPHIGSQLVLSGHLEEVLIQSRAELDQTPKVQNIPTLNFCLGHYFKAALPTCPEPS